MPEITIDNKKYNFNIGQTIFEVAEKNDIKIPVLCNLEGIEKHTSCMVCLVKDNMTGRFIPSCTARSEDGMSIDTTSIDVINARKDSLDLLLSNHIGDCIAPCKRSCPLNLDISLIMKHVENNEIESAYNLIVKKMPLPFTLTGLCNAYCEKVCRRSIIDKPVSIRSIKRRILKSGKYLIEKKNSNGKKIAIIGAGLNGLSICYFLLFEGFDCTVFEKNQSAGGRLLNDELKNKIDYDILGNEIDYIQELGAKFIFNIEFKAGLLIDKLKPEYDAIIIASDIDYESNNENIFKEYNMGPNPLVIVKHCKRSAEKITGFFNKKCYDKLNMFNSVILNIKNDQYKKTIIEDPEFNEYKNKKRLSDDEVLNESIKCLHCECHKADDCRLRIIAGEYNVKQSRFKIDNISVYTGMIKIGDGIIYDRDKCIKCGICVRLSEKNEIKNGFTFFGRGFELSIKLPFKNEFNENELLIIKDVIKRCPTGALKFSEG